MKPWEITYKEGVEKFFDLLLLIVKEKMEEAADENGQIRFEVAQAIWDGAVENMRRFSMQTEEVFVKALSKADPVAIAKFRKECEEDRAMMGARLRELLHPH